MWRDVFKWLSTRKTNSEFLKVAGYLFKTFNNSVIFSETNSDIGLNGLFTNDISYLRKLICDADSAQITYKPNMKYSELYKETRSSKDIFKIPIDTTDSNIKLSIINIDRPSFGLTTYFDKGLPRYVYDFISSHMYDLGSVTYEITMPRVVTQQEARHRINSISQMSQRYICEKNGSGHENPIYEPYNVEVDKVYRVKHRGRKIDVSYNSFNELSRNLYTALNEDGVPNETARFVLTNAVYSTMVVTKPYHTLPHYFKERTSKAAQYEIRLPAIALRSYINQEFTKLRRIYCLEEL